MIDCLKVLRPEYARLQARRKKAVEQAFAPRTLTGIKLLLADMGEETLARLHGGRPMRILAGSKEPLSSWSESLGRAL